MEKSKNLFNLIPWFVWLDNVLDVFFISLSYRSYFYQKFSPLILIRDTINNKFVERMAKRYILQIQYFLKLRFFECYFFKVGHVSLLLNIRKRIYKISDRTWNCFECCDFDRPSVFLDKFFKKRLTDSLVKWNLIFKDFFQSKHKKSINVIEVNFFSMIFVRVYKSFMIRYSGVIVFFFNSFCNISSQIIKFFSCRFKVVVFILVFFGNGIFLEWRKGKVDCWKVEWLLFFKIKEVRNLRETINALSQLVSIVGLTINFRDNINEWEAFN